MRRPLEGTPPISCDDACHRARGSAGGTDYAVIVGTHVLAPFAGTVHHVRSTAGGTTVRLVGDNGHIGYLMHLSDYVAADGQHVAEGELIALSGGLKGAPGSGSSTGPHLHADVVVDGRLWGMEEYLAHFAVRTAGSGTPINPPEEDDMPKPIYYAPFDDSSSGRIRHGQNTPATGIRMSGVYVQVEPGGPLRELSVPEWTLRYGDPEAARAIDTLNGNAVEIIAAANAR